jgi:Domain of unknown function (DUF4386)
MSSEVNRLPRTSLARVTGSLYLGFILTSVLADALGHIGTGQPAQVYDAIVTSPWSFRLALVIAFVSALMFLLSAWGLYVLLRLVNRDLALLFLLLNAIGVAIQCASMLSLISALLAVDSSTTAQAFSVTQLHGLAQLSVDVYKTGFVLAQLFFSAWLFPLGYLVYQSAFLPRFLGILLLVDGIGVLIWFLQALLLPAYPAVTYPGLAISFAAEVGLGLWLVIKAVNDSRIPTSALSPHL